MDYIVSTAVLNLLAQRKRLASRMQTLDFAREEVHFLQRLRREGAVAMSEEFVHLPLGKMVEHSLVSREEISPGDLIRRQRELRRQGRALFLLQAVNFEITYRCGMSCGHCLQRNLRDVDVAELDKDRIVQAMRQVWFAALPLAGINLTGGEPLSPDSPVLELIGEASSLGLPVRLNTNCWWGNGNYFAIGGRIFATPRILVAHLREIGLGMLAFSYDERIRQNDHALRNLIGAMRACEQNQMPYQVIFTGSAEQEIKDVLRLATLTVPFPLDHAIPVMMQKVDLGGAAGSLPGQRFDMNTISQSEIGGECRQGGHFCAGLGFHRPSYLHLSPDGAIRSCLYAPRLGNMGNLTTENLLDAINRFPSDPVSLAFQGSELPAHEDRLFRPYARLYRPIVHPCASCAVLARLIDEEHQFTLTVGHPPEGQYLEEINLRVAREYNLLRK